MMPPLLFWRAAFLALCLGSFQGLWAAAPALSFEVDYYQELGGTPKGVHIGWRNGIAHYPNDPEDVPARLYFICDREGNEKSEAVDWSYLPLKYDFIKFQWLEGQKYLVILKNRHKFFEVFAYARNRKGRYHALDTEVDDNPTLNRMVRLLTAKAVSKLKADEFESLLNPGAAEVLTDTLKVSERGLTFHVNKRYTARELDVLYRFDTGRERFMRLSTTLGDEDMEHKLLTVGEPEMTKLLKK